MTQPRVETTFNNKVIESSRDNLEMFYGVILEEEASEGGPKDYIMNKVIFCPVPSSWLLINP